MRTRQVWMIGVCALVGALAGRGQTQSPPAAGTRVGIINIQDAIIRTEEGQKAAKALQEKYAPRQTELEKQRRELEDLQAQLNKGRNTMSEDARNKLIRQIDQKNKALTRDNEDAQAEWQQEENKLINSIGQKMMAVIDKYAKEKGFHIILDISSPQSPVLYAVNTVDITTDIIGLYDKGAGSATLSSPAAAAPASVTRQPSTTTRPPAPTPKFPATRTPPPPTPK
ncbi:MAG: OmpH family outer membrane protein [Acidobacteria bacterium]|nr:OmpH family outer membrane protein [Acidobacteriota bacterium]